MRLLISILPLVLTANLAIAGGLNFSLHKIESEKPGPTLLVFGGIQGDEPGGFNAASLLVTNYSINKGKVWVIPNLNFESIIKRSRGVNGDLNRKFSELAILDPEFQLIQRVKKIILDPQVDMILNLHDGSGFYSKKYVSKKRNKNRWGQSIVIDQESIGESPLAQLAKTANRVLERTNKLIENQEHHYATHNTETRLGDKEMEKTLTYFAIKNGKPAAGIEASKTFPTHKRSWYHLQVLESYMQVMGIGFERDFELSETAVKDTINNNLKVALYQDRIFFDVTRARNRLNYVPLKKNTPLEFKSSNPLVAIIEGEKHLKVRYGNRGVTRLSPQFFDFDTSLKSVNFKIDDKPQEVVIGSEVQVDTKFLVEPHGDYRVNVIGYRKKGVSNESGISITKADIAKRFSVDRKGRFYRVEFYLEKQFSGMVLVKFRDSRLSTRPDPVSPHRSKLDSGATTARRDG